MGQEGQWPQPWRTSVIEWRARQISDPVKRLRYLRRVSKSFPGAGESGTWKRKAFIFSAPAIILGVVGFASVPFRTPAPWLSAAKPVNIRPAARVAPVATPPAPEVWPVDQSPVSELYSNGLRIENQFSTASEVRGKYPVYAADPKDAASASEPIDWRDEPAGIVFHSTESHQARFEPAEVHSLKRIGRNLLDYVRSQRSYHFVIDRFGRVYRVVHESDVAYHAGRSVWAQGKDLYVNLNASFLAVALESQTDAANPLSEAQVHAARVLTEMLRSRFHIPAANCVTHAQVSVNPSNMRIGYHTDWAGGFPFAALGLPDNYAQTVPSMALFGFGYDDAFLGAIGGEAWSGLATAARVIDERARAAGLSPSQYRKRLQQRYRKIMSAHRA
jgi:hypothetical protein